MNNHTEAPPLPLSCSKKIVRGVWMALAVGLVVAVALIAVYFFRRGGRFIAEVEKAHAQGLPVTLPELDRFYHNDVDADQRGNEIISILGNYDNTLESKDGVFYWARLAKPGEIPTSDALSHMREHLFLNRGYLDDLHSILVNGADVRYPMELWRGRETEFPHLAQVRNALRMFSIEVQVAIADHDIKSVSASLRDSRLLAETLARDPLEIAQLFRIACHSIADSQLEYALNSELLVDEQLQAIVAQLKSIKLEGIVAYGLIGDRCMYYPDVSFDIGIPVRWLLGLRPIADKSLHHANNVNAFLAFSDVIEIGDLPTWERISAVKRLALSSNWSTRSVHIYDRIMMDTFVRMYKPENRALTDLRSAIVGVSVLLYAHRHQESPSNLDELVTDYLDSIPPDPFDGRPLRYREWNKGFVVYGVGDDGDDDNGDPPSEGEKISEGGDISFRILDVRPHISPRSLSGR